MKVVERKKWEEKVNLYAWLLCFNWNAQLSLFICLKIQQKDEENQP